MASLNTNFAAVRACIFDMGSLLINSEDVITHSMNQILETYGRPPFTRSIRAQLKGIPDLTNGDTFHDWAKLPISREQFAREASDQMSSNFPNCKPLPGAQKLLSILSSARSARSGSPIKLAPASTSKRHSYELKTSKPEAKHVLGFFPDDSRVLGDDPRIQKGRSKPAPDIYLVALQCLNAAACSGETLIKPSECLVFEDSVIGVEAGRRAGMRVVWVPHPEVAVEYRERQKEVLAGRSGLSDLGQEWQLGGIHDGWAEMISSLEVFDYEKYGIQISY